MNALFKTLWRALMNLFKRDNTRKKWHEKAWMVNPNKTKIILAATAVSERKHVPPWIHGA
jgi:hypothetical protein